MRLFHAVGLTSLLVDVALGLDASGQGKDKDNKFEVPKDNIAGKVKSVDMKAPSFTITVDKERDRTFLVDKATEFWGPRGGDHAGLAPLTHLAQAHAFGRRWYSRPPADTMLLAANAFCGCQETGPKRCY
jgi:hypothetical protein